MRICTLLFQQQDQKTTYDLNEHSLNIHLGLHGSQRLMCRQ
jgi:hypothetical protein